jgi:hypothetical protein
MSTSMTRRIAAACLGTLLAGGLAACGSVSASASSLITVAQARTVAQLWLHADNAAELDQLSGSLQRIDHAAERLRTPGPDPTPDQRVHDDTIWMAPQSKYPLSFLCFDKPLSGPGKSSSLQLFRFSKASAAAPWKVTHAVIFASVTSRPAVALDASGFAQTVSPKDYGKYLVSPARLAYDWAAYLQAGNASDAAEFAPGVLTTQQIQANQKQVSDNAAKHYVFTHAYAPTDDPVDAYVLKDGSALVLVGLEQTSHVVAQQDPMTVTEDGKGVVGPAPGTYRESTTVVLVMATFTDPAKGSTQKVSGTGAYFGPVTTTATKV